MNGIAVRVGRIKGRCLGDITCTAVNYWVLVVRGGHEARFAEPPRFTCMNLGLSPALATFTLLSKKKTYDVIYFPLLPTLRRSLNFDGKMIKKDASVRAKMFGLGPVLQNS
jgi:hypothetical protein